MKSMTGIHHELFQNHERAVRATHTYGTYRLTKSGTPSKQPTTTHATESEAQTKAAYLMSVNPGATYVVRGL